MLLLSETAATVWAFFHNLLGIDGPFATIGAALQNWWKYVNGSSIKAWLFRIVLVMILWHIWKARNVAKFDKKDMPLPQVIINAIRMDMHLLYKAHMLRLKQRDGLQNAIIFFLSGDRPYNR